MESSDTPSPELLFVTCGGTIDKIYFDAKGEYAVGPPQVAGLLEEANVGFPYHLVPVVRKDSLEMTEEDREAIRAVIVSQACRRVVVTHGTDTMIRTGLALRQAGLGEAGFTVILTGSMQPARFRSSDAEFNIGTAVVAARLLPPGIYIAMNGQVFDPGRARKNLEVNRFEAVEQELEGPSG